MTKQIDNELLPCELHQLFDYNADTGVLYWKSRQRVTGRSVGAKDSKGRLRTEINGKSYAVHHVIFALHYNRWPIYQLDHINQIKDDNRICNLREATNTQNSYNRKSKNKLAKGVSLHKGKYIARIRANGVTKHLGSYDNLAAAAKSYEIASVKYHGEFACPKN
jgi:hypothetical protein